MRPTILLLCLTTASCVTGGSGAPEPASPALTVALRHWQGTSLGGPQATAVTLDPAVDAWTVETRVDWIAATTSELSRTADLVAVAADSRLVTSVGAADPFLVAPTQLERAFVWAPTADEASWTALAGTVRSVEYTSLTGLLIDGFTVALELTGTATDPDLPHCAVELERDGDRARLSLVVRGDDPSQATSIDSDSTPTEEGVSRPMRLPVEQRAALATTLGPGDAPLFALLPSPFDGGRSTFVVEIAINDADESTIEALIGQLEQQVNAPLESPFATVDTVRRIELTTALASLEGDRRRAALSYLALESGSALAADLALVADDALLEMLVERTLDDLRGVILTADEAQNRVGWYLESEGLRLLVERARRDELAPALESVLLRHTGELGRFPSTLEDAVDANSSIEGLEARFLEENRILLEDPDPSARRRAYRWLLVRDRAPLDYDPLGDSKERRAAIAADALREQESAQ